MRIKVRAVGVALAAAVGVLAFSGVASAATNVGNNGLVNLGDVTAGNVQACNSPVNAVIGVTGQLASPQTVGNCVNADGQVGGVSGGDNNVGNNGLINTADVTAGNVQLCNSPVNAGIAATAQLVSPQTIDNCVNSKGQVGGTVAQGNTNVGNNGLLLNTGDVTAANGQLCNNPVNAGIALTVPVGSPSTVGECVNSKAHVPGDGNAYKKAAPAVKPVPVKAAAKAKPAKVTKTAPKAKPAKATKVKPVKKAKKH
ncbi:hypothetical protein [Longispora albida]|uniref:hypothetical protein n=1 Tax=Longispora albida TaxID=203523 RepID=UPI0003726096|nr:hypothetical protein [Longispora albida]